MRPCAGIQSVLMDGLVWHKVVCGSLLGSILNVHATAEKLGPSKDTVEISICHLNLKLYLSVLH
jgi:hypothetical protein